METNNSNLPVNIESFTQIMQGAPAVLERNQLSVSKANSAGQALVDTVDGMGGINSDELDEKVAEYINNVKVTVKSMNTRRAPLTQLLTAVAKKFTTLENEIDLKNTASLAYKLQEARNKYAAEKLAEQKRREAEARKVQMFENEKIQYKADVTLLLENAYNLYVTKHINYINGLFERVTLENYNAQAKALNETSTAFSWTDFVQTVKDNIQTFYIDAATRTTIKNSVATEKKHEFANRYKFEIEDLKTALIERLPSKKKELEELEVLRQQDAVKAKQAEEEQRQREEAERAKREEERRKAEQEAKMKAEAEKTVAGTQTLFDMAAAATPVSTVNVKVEKKIEVLNPSGYVLLYQKWFQDEGMHLPMADLEKIHKKMITYCEKLANKEDATIKSPLIRYIDNVKAK